jgi:hypothetical protein
MTIAEEKVLLEKSILTNIDVLNDNRCVKILKKKFYKSLLTNDITLQFKRYTKLFIILNKKINNFILPIGLKYNFSTTIFFTNDDNEIYFATTLSINSNSKPINSSYNFNNQFITTMFDSFKKNSLLSSLLPVIFLNFISTVNKSTDQSWQTCTNNDTTLQCRKTGSTTGTITSGVVSFDIETTNTSSINYCNNNGYNGIQIDAGNTGTINFSNIPIGTVFGSCISGGAGGRNSIYGGGGGGCFYSEDLSIAGIRINTTNSIYYGSGFGSQGGKIYSQQSFFDSIECAGGTDGTSSRSGYGGGYTGCLNSGFNGGDGGANGSTPGKDALQSYGINKGTPVGNIPCVSSSITVGGGGGTTDSTNIYATSGNGYGGSSYTSTDNPPTEWTTGTPIVYGGGAGTNVDSNTGQPYTSENGMDGCFYLWWS